MSYLPYEQPGITTLLSLTSFLLLLNCIRFLLDRFLYCGLIGEILIGIIWGLPVGGTSWLSSGTQHTIQSLGYLGLISLVFEGGLATDPKQLRKALVVSVSVATVGLLLPIALSFLLLLFPFQSTEGTVYPTPLAGFSAGASLCSTSLGTTFAILSAAGMQTTRTGTVLVGAAMMDDVVGLVMVNIVTTLGKGGNSGWPIARPIVASFGLLLVTLVIAPFVLMPVWMVMVRMHEGKGQDASAEKGKTRTQLSGLLKSIPHLSFMLSTFVLVVYVTIAAFIDASVLFAAFIAGGIVRYLWTAGSKTSETEGGNGSAEMYNGYYKPVMEYMLVPFFFASIGFSIPITSMFKGSIVWKGIVYSVLMALSKAAVAGILYVEYYIQLWNANRKRNIPSSSTATYPDQSLRELPHAQASIVAFAMVARGEIGYLIASLSQSSGTLRLQHRDGIGIEESGEEIFLVIIWAVTLCTIAGPVSVGILVRRFKARLSDPAALNGW